MIDFYYSGPPNGRKVKLLLEETALAHRLRPVSLSRGEQFRPEFLAISPNGKIPAIVDHEPADGGAPLAVFESGAIMMYLGDKAGRFVPRDARARMELMQWLFWANSGLGPMSGQIGHFNVYAPEKVPYAVERYTRETRRLYGVLDKRLADRDYVVGDYSIVDMACYPWIVPHRAFGQDLAEFPRLRRWFETLAARPAVARTYSGVKDVYDSGAAKLSEEARMVLFGQPKLKESKSA